MSTAAAATLEPGGANWRSGLVLGAFVVLWADLCHQLSYQWRASEQYSFGWFVPGLVLLLLFKRWMDRPPAGGLPSSVSRLGGLGVLALALPLAASRVVYEANPDWPLVSWAYSAGVVGLTLLAILGTGGRARLVHFAFPVVFVLVAVRWPWKVEQLLTQQMMQAAASLTVEFLGILGIPAMRQGNLIELSTGVLGVEEACSGIRSFQSSLMIALFLGENERLKAWQRCLLVPVAVVFAFTFNVARTLFLAWNAAHHGPESVARWHDSAGLTVFVACFLVLWSVCLLLKRFSGTPAGAGGAGTGAVPGGGCSSLPSRRLAAALAGVAVGVVGINQAWFLLREGQGHARYQWSVSLPKSAQDFRELSLSERENELLRHDALAAAAWRDERGIDWRFYYLQWFPGSVGTRVFARAHRPEICLIAAGRTLREEMEAVPFESGPLRLRFRKYLFDDNGHPLHVFYAVWEDSEHELPRTANLLSFRDRLQVAWAGVRQVEQRSIEIILSGAADVDAAEASLRAWLPKLVQVQGAARRP